MPRFTLIEMDNFPDTRIDVIVLPYYLEEDMYRHQKDIDFASEAEVYEAIAGWPPPRPPIVRMIIEYENIGTGRWHVKGLIAQYQFGDLIFSVPYRTSLVVSIDHEGRMYSGMLPLTEEILRVLTNPRHIVSSISIPRIIGEPPANFIPPSFNPAQSTHTLSVHQSVIKAIKKLQARYPALDEEESYAELKARLAELKRTDFPELTDRVKNALRPGINRLDTITSAKESKSNLTVKRMLALVWTAINDEKILLVEKEVALKALIKNLYEIQRGGNLDELGKDDGKSDNPICLSGTINKLVDTLNTIHPDVETIYVTKASASSKFPALMREYAVNFIKNSTEKTALFEQITRNKQADGYPIPESVLVGIKENVEQAFKEEFANYLEKKDLENIFSSYKSVNLTENNVNSINILILCEEQVNVLRAHIDDLNKGLQNVDVTEENKLTIAALSKTLNAMLDKLIEDIKQKDGLSKTGYREFREGFSRQLNENALFSYSKFEALRQQVLMLLNRLIEILSGKKIASISSKTAFFKKKQAMHSSLKESFKYAIYPLSTACSA